MATETIDTGRNEVEIDLDKYTNLVLKLDEANDKIKEMERMSKEPLKIAAKNAKPRDKFSFGALFMDDNTINEKSIIGFASFLMMLCIWYCRFSHRILGQDITISDTIYTSFVVVTLGSFGIAEMVKHSVNSKDIERHEEINKNLLLDPFKKLGESVNKFAVSVGSSTSPVFAAKQRLNDFNSQLANARSKFEQETLDHSQCTQ